VDALATVTAGLDPDLSIILTIEDRPQGVQNSTKIHMWRIWVRGHTIRRHDVAELVLEIRHTRCLEGEHNCLMEGARIARRMVVIQNRQCRLRWSHQGGELALRGKARSAVIVSHKEVY
jgi:hypothetical protein